MQANIEAVKAKIERAQQQLEEQLAALQTSDDWRGALERMAVLGPSRVTRYSFRNILLLGAQRPDARHVATYKTWLRLGRQVKKGEKGLTVLRPRLAKVSEPGGEEGTRIVGVSYLTVFAIEQTDGEPLAAPVLPERIDSPEGFAWTLERLTELVAKLPGVAGITLRERARPEEMLGAEGWYGLGDHQIVVITGESPHGQVFKTLLHEVAHAVLHGDGEHHATPTAEVEAESTAYVVAHALGMDTSGYSLPYVAGWALATDEKQPTKAVAAVGERIRKGAATILEALFPETTEAEPEQSEAA